METNTTLHRRSVVYLMLCAALWSSSGLLIKAVSWNALAILGGRSLFAIFVFLLYMRKVRVPTSKWQILSILGSVGTQILFVTATKMTTAANAIFLQYTAPVYSAILAYFVLKERLKKADWITMAIILPGMALFFLEQLSLEGMTGNVLAILSGVALAVMIVASRKLTTEESGTAMLWTYFVCAVIGFPSMVQSEFTWPAIGAIIFLGVFQIGLSFVFYTMAMPYVEAVEANLILTLEPVLNPIWVAIVIGEIPGVFPLIGSAMVIGAVLLRAWLSTHKESIRHNS